MPDIREVILTWRNERVYAFAVFPPAIDHKQEAYADDHFLHQLSNALQGIPVTYSNSTGFRLVALLDGQHDRLPLRVDYLDHLPGHICLGCGAAGRELALT
ncbi:hypothetical protein TFLX_06101 [Thermoflexales bacterium]|nr:hypothetical protein TFLX_06101 [Thermoflexales bacterium]